MLNSFHIKSLLAGAATAASAAAYRQKPMTGGRPDANTETLAKERVR